MTRSFFFHVKAGHSQSQQAAADGENRPPAQPRHGQAGRQLADGGEDPADQGDVVGAQPAPATLEQEDGVASQWTKT